MPMESTAQYEQRALREAIHAEREVDTQPLSDRKEAKEEFFRAMADHPDLVGERVGWLIDGNYGHGEMQRAKQVVASSRMNRRAALTHLVGVYEWKCPVRMGIEAWKKLTAAQKADLDRVLDVVISAAEREMAGEG